VLELAHPVATPCVDHDEFPLVDLEPNAQRRAHEEDSSNEPDHQPEQCPRTPATEMRSATMTVQLHEQAIAAPRTP
jgi:hypothetical protein